MKTTRKLARYGLGLSSAALVLCLAAPASADHGPKLKDQIYALSGAGGGVANIIDSRSNKVIAALPTGPGGTLGGTTPDGTKLYVGAAAVGAT